MHPIFAEARRLGLYLIGWMPLCALLFSLLTPSHLPWQQGLALSVPLCFVYAFLCLAAWYVCRGLPIKEGNFLRLLTTHMLNGAIGAGLLVLLARTGLSLMQVPAERSSGILPLIFGVGVLFYFLAVSVNYILLAIEASQVARQKEQEARTLAGKAELRALRAQINPHFLYNSLNSISALTSIDPSRARQMCIELSDFLRNTLGMSEQQAIPLRHEVDLIQRYLSIEKVRFGSRLAVDENIARDCEMISVPPLILQPLVENAIVHGIAGMIETGVLRIQAKRAGGDRLEILIENSFDPVSVRKRENGFGLATVRKRLHAAYGQEAQLKTSNDGTVFRVELSLPDQEKQQEKQQGKQQ